MKLFMTLDKTNKTIKPLEDSGKLSLRTLKNEKSRMISKWVECVCAVLYKSELKSLRGGCQIPKFPVSTRENKRFSRSHVRQQGMVGTVAKLRGHTLFKAAEASKSEQVLLCGTRPQNFYIFPFFNGFGWI